MSALFETLGIEGYFARSADEFLKLVYEHNPHVAFAHIQEVGAVLKLKRHPSVGGTPTIIVNSLGLWGDKAMSEAGLIGPTIQLPFNGAHLTAAIECFGRSGDQPFPEPIPYLIGDPSLLEPAALSTKLEAQRRFLVVSDECFGRIYVSRTLNGLGQIVHAPTRREAHAAMASKLDLVIVVATVRYAVREIERSARAVGVPMLALVGEDWIEEANKTMDGKVNFHSWPLSKVRLVEAVEAILGRTPQR